MTHAGARDGNRLDVVARLLAVLVLSAFVLITFRLFNGLTAPFLAFAMAGGALILIASKPRPVALIASVALGAILFRLYSAMHGQFGEYTLAGPAACLAFWGLGSTLVLGYSAVFSNRALPAFLLTIFCPLLVIVTNIALILMISLQPLVYDRRLYRFDALFGFQASEMVGRWFQNYQALQSICFIVYNALPLVATLIFLLYLKKRPMVVNPLYAFCLAGLLGCLCYQILPAAGPVHLFPRFPDGLPATVALTPDELPMVPRNAIPSLHFAWALLILRSVAKLSIVARISAGVFLILTLLATLGFGEHYLIDLVVAVPFAASVQAFCVRRWSLASAAMTITLAWLLYLRFGIGFMEPAPSVAWTLAALTVAAGIFIQTPRSIFGPSDDRKGIAALPIAVHETSSK